MTAEEMAQRFHEAYERLAPKYGYQTRPETALPWHQVPTSNRRLMVAVCNEVLPAAIAEARADEREACALVAQDVADNLIADHGYLVDKNHRGVAEHIARAIRAREESS